MRRKKWFGMDRFEVVVHVLVTIMVAAAVGNLPSPRSEFGVALVFASSLLLLAWRRKKALKEDPEMEIGAERMEDLEYRVADLEQAQQRVLELEERLDFTERLLARQRVRESLPEERFHEP